MAILFTAPSSVIISPVLDFRLSNVFLLNAGFPDLIIYIILFSILTFYEHALKQCLLL